MAVTCRLVHQMLGRARIRLEAPELFKDLRPCLELFLRAQPGLRSFRLTPGCQSLTMSFDPRLLAVEDFLTRLRSLSRADLEAYRTGLWRGGNFEARVCAVIPARNEAPTVGAVVDAASRATLIDEVIVVDNCSSDETASVAAAAGARVVTCDQLGKGEAMRAGVDATDAGVIVFLDADLIGLRPEHVDGLARPVVEGRAGMVCGLFDRGWLNPMFLHALPVLTGERAVVRWLFESIDPAEARGYRIEAALNFRCSELAIPTQAFVCDGLWHRTKERKYANPAEGFVRKALMLSSAATVYATRTLGGHVVKVSGSDE